jgi:hypothetical protein
MLKTPFFAYSMGNEGGRDSLLTIRMHLVNNIQNIKPRVDTSPPKTFVNKPCAMAKRSAYKGFSLIDDD